MATILFASCLLASLAPVSAASLKSLGTKDVIVQMFEWPWASLASECTNNLGPAGYGYIQTSTPHEHILGSQWWTDYQVVSYNLTSKRGNRADFANMVSACNKAGVGVVIDLISNHMTATTSTATQYGFGGGAYSSFNYPVAGYSSSNFHYCNNGQAADISDYTNRYDAQFCQEGGLQDLAQEQEVVQDRLAAYMNDLMSLGVAGFRVDSALEQPAANLTAIFDRLEKDWWATCEVDADQNGQIQQNEYWPFCSTMVFAGTRELQSHFASGGIANLVTPTPMSTTWNNAGAHMYPPSASANLFVTNHDCERGYTNSISYTSANNAYVLAHIFLLAFNYGHPTVYSGYDFGSFDQGAPANSDGTTQQVTCYSNGWRCEQRWDAIVGMVGFHNAVGTAALANAQKGTDQQIGFERAAKGFVAINNTGSTWTVTFTTGLPNGTYKDVIHKNSDGSSPTITVSGGKFSVSITAYDAIAIHV
ncbi:glycoside hydrolase superfamily [Xylariaceae sp. FL1272]|nr:glycoside hydrolase superfamily [Xylariaceae sp. FL1272]